MSNCCHDRAGFGRRWCDPAGIGGGEYPHRRLGVRRVRGGHDEAEARHRLGNHYRRSSRRDFPIAVRFRCAVWLPGNLRTKGSLLKAFDRCNITLVAGAGLFGAALVFSPGATAVPAPTGGPECVAQVAADDPALVGAEAPVTVPLPGPPIPTAVLVVATAPMAEPAGTPAVPAEGANPPAGKGVPTAAAPVDVPVVLPGPAAPAAVPVVPVPAVVPPLAPVPLAAAGPAAPAAAPPAAVFLPGCVSEAGLPPATAARGK